MCNERPNQSKKWSNVLHRRIVTFDLFGRSNFFRANDITPIVYHAMSTGSERFTLLKIGIEGIWPFLGKIPIYNIFGLHLMKFAFFLLHANTLSLSDGQLFFQMHNENDRKCWIVNSFCHFCECRIPTKMMASDVPILDLIHLVNLWNSPKLMLPLTVYDFMYISISPYNTTICKYMILRHCYWI